MGAGRVRCRVNTARFRDAPSTCDIPDATPSVAPAPMTNTTIPPIAALVNPPTAWNTLSSSICSGVISATCLAPSLGLAAGVAAADATREEERLARGPGHTARVSARRAVVRDIGRDARCGKRIVNVSLKTKFWQSSSYSSAKP